MYIVTFRINLIGSLHYATQAEIDVIIATRTAQIPIGMHGGTTISGRHGDTFTLYGSQAAYVKRLVEQNFLVDLEVYAPAEEESSSSDVNLYGMYTNSELLYFMFPIGFDVVEPAGLTVGRTVGSLIERGNIPEYLYATYSFYKSDEEQIYTLYTIYDPKEFRFFMSMASGFENTGSIGGLEVTGELPEYADLAAIAYYAEGNAALIVSNSTFHSINLTTGETTFIKDDGVFNFINSMCFHNGVLYAVGEGSKLLTFDPITGDTQTIEDKLFVAMDDESDIYFMEGLCSHNGTLYAIAYLNGYIPYLITINTDSLIGTRVDELALPSGMMQLFSLPRSDNVIGLGLSTSEFYGFTGDWGHNDGELNFRLNKNLVHAELTEDDLHVDWTDAEDFPDVLDWTPIEIDIRANEDNNFYDIFTANPSESSVVFRVRLADDDSGYFYYIQED